MNTEQLDRIVNERFEEVIAGFENEYCREPTESEKEDIYYSLQNEVYLTDEFDAWDDDDWDDNGYLDFI